MHPAAGIAPGRASVGPLALTPLRPTRDEPFGSTDRLSRSELASRSATAPSSVSSGAASGGRHREAQRRAVPGRPHLALAEARPASAREGMEGRAACLQALTGRHTPLGVPLRPSNGSGLPYARRRTGAGTHNLANTRRARRVGLAAVPGWRRRVSSLVVRVDCPGDAGDGPPVRVIRPRILRSLVGQRPRGAGEVRVLRDFGRGCAEMLFERPTLRIPLGEPRLVRRRGM